MTWGHQSLCSHRCQEVYLQLRRGWGAHIASDGCAWTETSPKFISAGSDASQCSLCEASSCPCGGWGLYRAEEGAMATGIHGIVNVGCKEERGEGWMEGCALR